MSKLTDVLNKPVNKLGEKAEKYPTKTTMNLYVRQQSADNPIALVITALLLAVFVFLFTKIAVLNRLDEVRVARSEYSEILNTKQQLETELQDYDSVHEDYYRYTESYLSDGDAVLVDRVEILNMLKGAAEGYVEITGISISENSVIVTVKTDALEDVGSYKEKLEQNPVVTSVMVYNAEKSLVKNILYSSSQTDENSEAAEDPQQPEYIEQVTATMMLQVKYPEEEADS